MSKCPQVEIQELEERLEVAAYVATERQAYIAELEAEVDVANANLNTVRRQRRELEAGRDSLMNDMQRIYDNCSDTDLIIDIAGAALEVEK